MRACSYALEKEEDANALAFKISDATTVKVVVAVLLMLVFEVFLKHICS